MTIEQRIQWVVLPAGLSPDGTQALVSVFVAPRLSVDGDGQGATLAPFEDFLDWPALLANARFMLDTATVDEGTGRSTAAGAPFGPLTLAGNPADSNLWKRFFHPDTPLDSFAFDDYAPRAKVTYAAADLARAGRRAYADIASASPTELPDPAAMSGFAGFPSSEDMPDTLQNVAEKLDDADARAADDPTGNVQPDLSSAQEQFLAFHPQIRDGSTGAGELPEPPPRPDKPKPDFHQMLSALGDHPALLRRLGLVIDLALPVDQLPRTHGGLGLVLVPTVPSALPDSANVPDTPATLYVLDQDGNFCAAASGSDPLGPPARGLLALPVSESDDGVERPDTYRIEQTDTDGTNLKLLAASAAADAPPEGSPAPAAPPTVRTTGLALVHTGHAQALQSDLLHAADQHRQRDDDGLTTFTSEDLVRGYRVDVNDRGKWRSLNERIVSYNPPGAQAGTPPIVPPVTDEGFVQTGLMQPDGPDGRVHVHEHMVTWNGWALSAPLPGNVMVDGYDPNGGPGTPDPTAGPQPVRNEAFTKLPLEIETAPKPGSLPRLRFGAQYKLRVRTVDLAGNGPTVDQATDRMDQDDLALPVGGTTFRRHEPVPAPLLLPRSPFLEGTGAHRMVIRSDDGQSTAAYAAAFNASPLVAGGTHPPYLPVDERHLVAPKASLECVERHGKLDDAIASGNSTTRQAVYQLAVRESGSLDDPGLPGFRAAPDTPGHPGGYTLHTGESIQVPYLPDPLSLGVVFHGLPGLPENQRDEPFEVPWAGAQWHTPRSLRLRVVEGSGPPVLDAAARVLTVSLPKAAVAVVRVSSKVRVDEGIMGMLRWCHDELGDSSDGFAAIMNAARSGRHWMLTPWYELTLVHAVQHPLMAPVLEIPDLAGRDHGETAEHLSGTVGVDPASTDRIDLFAEWTEVTDDPAQEEPGTPQDRAAPVFGLTLPKPPLEGSDVPDDPASLPFVLAGGTLFFNTRAAEQARADGDSSIPPTLQKQEFGDTKHRTVRYHVVATTPFADSFPADFGDHPEQQLLSRPGEQPVDVTHTVFSSAKPAAPKVIDVVPTQSFDASGSLPGTLTRRRLGGLRVYLERPWFSSGEGELLGVLVRDEGSDAPESSYPFISVMGRDPIHVSAPVSAPTASAFPGAATVAAGLPLPEPSDFTAGFTVTAVGYEPRFDRDAGRWFCDIDLDTGGAYFPFVRLALTRFQPDSLPGDHLSQIVLTDNLRVLPERVLTVAGTDPLLVQLSGPNYTVPGGADTGVRPARATAFLQERDPELDDDAVAWFTLEDSASPLDRVDDVSLSASDYTGQLPLPGGGPDSGAARRLLVVEEAVTVAYHPEDPESGTQGSVVYMDTVNVESPHHDGPHPGPHGPHDGPHDGPHGPHDGPHDGPHGGPHDGPHGPHDGPHGGPHDGPHGGPHGPHH